MKIFKIFDNEKEIYSKNLSVNTVYFKGKIYGEIKKYDENIANFTIKLSNGKMQNNEPNHSNFNSNEEKSAEQWRKPTFAYCTAFGQTAQKLLENYGEKDEIQLIAKFYSKQKNGKFYNGFIVKEILGENSQKKNFTPNNSQNYNSKLEQLTDDDLPF